MSRTKQVYRPDVRVRLHSTCRKLNSTRYYETNLEKNWYVIKILIIISKAIT